MAKITAVNAQLGINYVTDDGQDVHVGHLQFNLTPEEAVTILRQRLSEDPNAEHSNIGEINIFIGLLESGGIVADNPQPGQEPANPWDEFDSKFGFGENWSDEQTIAHMNSMSDEVALDCYKQLMGLLQQEPELDGQEILDELNAVIASLPTPGTQEYSAAVHQVLVDAFNKYNAE